jgi:hypothetical protein
MNAVAVQLRSVDGERRAMPRRIHGVRFAITSTARSDRRIMVRGPGVGVDASLRSGSVLSSRSDGRVTADHRPSCRLRPP